MQQKFLLTILFSFQPEPGHNRIFSAIRRQEKIVRELLTGHDQIGLTPRYMRSLFFNLPELREDDV